MYLCKICTQHRSCNRRNDFTYSFRYSHKESIVDKSISIHTYLYHIDIVVIDINKNLEKCNFPGSHTCTRLQYKACKLYSVLYSVLRKIYVTCIHDDCVNFTLPYLSLVNHPVLMPRTFQQRFQTIIRYDTLIQNLVYNYLLDYNLTDLNIAKLDKIKYVLFRVCRSIDAICSSFKHDECHSV